MNHKINLSEISIMDFSFDQDHFSVVPGCYLNLNKKIIQNFYHLCSDKSILEMITEENPTSRFTLKNAQRFLEETIEYYNKKHFSFFFDKKRNCWNLYGKRSKSYSRDWLFFKKII